MSWSWSPTRLPAVASWALPSTSKSLNTIRQGQAQDEARDVWGLKPGLGYRVKRRQHSRLVSTVHLPTLRGGQTGAFVNGALKSVHTFLWAALRWACVRIETRHR